MENFAPAGEYLDRRSTAVGSRMNVAQRRGGRSIVVDATVNHRILAQDFRRSGRLLTLEARAAGRWQLQHLQSAV